MKGYNIYLFLRTKSFAEFMVNILLKEYNKPDVVTNIDLNSIV